MDTSLVAGLDIDFTRLLTFVIHKRDFKTSSTYPFAILIFELCRDAGVPHRNSDVLRTLTGTVDIGLIMDEANMAVPRRGPRVDLQPPSENLADTVDLAQVADSATSEPTNTTSA